MFERNLVSLSDAQYVLVPHVVKCSETSLLSAVDLLRVIIFIVEFNPYLILLFFVALVNVPVAIILLLVWLNPLLAGLASDGYTIAKQFLFDYYAESSELRRHLDALLHLLLRVFE